jgi:hypothetical protein
MEWIDGKLTLADGHVFERGDLSRAAYRFMTSWIERNFDPELSPDQNWARAEKAWAVLTPEVQANLILINNTEVQCGDNIRQGLLETLAYSQGFTTIKDLFETAIRGVNYN